MQFNMAFDSHAQLPDEFQRAQSVAEGFLQIGDEQGFPRCDLASFCSEGWGRCPV